MSGWVRSEFSVLDKQSLQCLNIYILMYWGCCQNCTCCYPAEIAVINSSNELDLIYFGRIPAVLVVSALPSRPAAFSSRPMSCSSLFPSLCDVFKCLGFQMGPSESRGPVLGSRTQRSWQLYTRCSLKSQLNGWCSIMHQGQVLVPCTKAHSTPLHPDHMCLPAMKFLSAHSWESTVWSRSSRASLIFKQMAAAWCFLQAQRSKPLAFLTLVYSRTGSEIID